MVEGGGIFGLTSPPPPKSRVEVWKNELLMDPKGSENSENKGWNAEAA